MFAIKPRTLKRIKNSTVCLVLAVNFSSIYAFAEGNKEKSPEEQLMQLQQDMQAGKITPFEFMAKMQALAAQDEAENDEFEESTQESSSTTVPQQLPDFSALAQDIQNQSANIYQDSLNNLPPLEKLYSLLESDGPSDLALIKETVKNIDDINA